MVQSDPNTMNPAVDVPSLALGPPPPSMTTTTTPTTTSTGAAAGGGGAPTSLHRHTRSAVPETYSALASSVSSFLAVSIHQILYLRAIYPQFTFIPVRHFNHPVKQSRHPKICNWVTDACAAVHSQLLKCTVATVSVIILSVRTNRPLERYTFDMTQMPQVPSGDIHTPFESITSETQPTNTASLTKGSSNADLEAQFRAVLARLASACARLTPLPPGEEYIPTLQITLRDDAEAPAGVNKEDQLWIAAEPGTPDICNSPARSPQENGFLHDGFFPEKIRHVSSRSTPDSGAFGDIAGKEKEKVSRGRAKTVPVRTVDAGEMKLEVWVEEAKGKFEELDRINSENSP